MPLYHEKTGYLICMRQPVFISLLRNDAMHQHWRFCMIGDTDVFVDFVHYIVHVFTVSVNGDKGFAFFHRIADFFY